MGPSVNVCVCIYTTGCQATIHLNPFNSVSTSSLTVQLPANTSCLLPVSRLQPLSTMTLFAALEWKIRLVFKIEVVRPHWGSLLCIKIVLSIAWTLIKSNWTTGGCLCFYSSFQTVFPNVKKKTKQKNPAGTWCLTVNDFTKKRVFRFLSSPHLTPMQICRLWKSL